MAIPKKILKFLEKSKVKFEILEHKTVYTAFDKAQTLKVPEKIVGKTLVIKKDRDLVLGLIPADCSLDLKRIKQVTKGKKIELASEKLIKNKLKGAKVGAIPPFGFLWKIPTFIDKRLMKEKEIILNGGAYNFSIKINPKNLENLIPDLVVGSFSKKK